MNYTEEKKKSIYKWRDSNREAYLTQQKNYFSKNKEKMTEKFKENYKAKSTEIKEKALKRYYLNKAWKELLQIDI